MYLKSFRSFQTEKQGRSCGFQLMLFQEWCLDGNISSGVLGWAEPTAGWWAQPRLKHRRAPQQASRCVTQYTQEVVSVHKWCEFPFCCYCDMLGRNGINSSYLLTQKRVSVAKLPWRVRSNCQVLRASWMHCFTLYPCLLICNNQHRTTFSGKRWWSICLYGTEHYESLAWLYFLTWQSTLHMNPTATSKYMPFTLFGGQLSWFC